MVVMDARTYALSLPGAQEQIHHGMASFRVRGKIFATVTQNTSESWRAKPRFLRR